MSGPFHSSKYSVARAKHHVRDLERQLIEFFDSHPYGKVVDIGPETGEQVHKFKLIKPMPVALPGLAVDAVNNLRSALDQAGYAVGTGKRKKTAFPFADDALQLENVINRGCKDLPKEIVDIMRAFKPYKGGNNLLWALNRLCNTHKHGFISPVAIANGGVRYRHAKAIGDAVFPAPVWNRTKNEMEFVRLRPGGEFEADIECHTFIAVHDVEFVDGQPVDAVLKYLIGMVESIVMAIEAEAIRLKLV